jgi:hypothetical protein
MGTDFFDEDLIKPSEPAADGVTTAARDEAPGERADEDGGRLLQKRRERDGQLAGASHEIEELRKRQTELEQRKGHLEELARKQQTYEELKRSVWERLDGGMIVLEKEEARAGRMVDLYAETRARVAETLEEIRAIDEESWSEQSFEEELNRALARVREADEMQRKGAARIEAADWRRGKGASRAPALEAGTAVSPVKQMGFLFWLKAGLALSLPLLVLGAALFAAYLYLVGLI